MKGFEAEEITRNKAAVYVYRKKMSSKHDVAWEVIRHWYDIPKEEIELHDMFNPRMIFSDMMSNELHECGFSVSRNRLNSFERGYLIVLSFYGDGVSSLIFYGKADPNAVPDDIKELVF